MVKREGMRNVVIEDKLWTDLKVSALKRETQLKDLLAEIIREWLKREEE